ncbi:MAG: hypothetical protein NVV59_15145 [Chitinophagaceae bacterium]|nr:hypothetical protein [Chitinophagaceae bacterium]
MLKKFIELYPVSLRDQSVIDLLARMKKKGEIEQGVMALMEIRGTKPILSYFCAGFLKTGTTFYQ